MPPGGLSLAHGQLAAAADLEPLSRDGAMKGLGAFPVVQLDDDVLDAADPRLAAGTENNLFRPFNIHFQHRDGRPARRAEQSADVRRGHVGGLARRARADPPPPFRAGAARFLADRQRRRVRPERGPHRPDAVAERGDVAPQHLVVGRVGFDGDDATPREAAEEIDGGVARVGAAVQDQPRLGEVVQTGIFPLDKDLMKGVDVARTVAADDRMGRVRRDARDELLFGRRGRLGLRATSRSPFGQHEIGVALKPHVVGVGAQRPPHVLGRPLLPAHVPGAHRRQVVGPFAPRIAETLVVARPFPDRQRPFTGVIAAGPVPRVMTGLGQLHPVLAQARVLGAGPHQPRRRPGGVALVFPALADQAHGVGALGRPARVGQGQVLFQHLLTGRPLLPERVLAAQVEERARAAVFAHGQLQQRQVVGPRLGLGILVDGQLGLGHDLGNDGIEDLVSRITPVVAGAGVDQVAAEDDVGHAGRLPVPGVPVAQPRRVRCPGPLQLGAPAGLEAFVQVQLDAHVHVGRQQAEGRRAGHVEAPRPDGDVVNEGPRLTQPVGRAVGAAGVGDDDEVGVAAGVHVGLDLFRFVLGDGVDRHLHASSSPGRVGRGPQHRLGYTGPTARQRPGRMRQPVASSPVSVPVLEPKRSTSRPSRWSMLTKRLDSGGGLFASKARYWPCLKPPPARMMGRLLQE